jgi:hypothetical protein
MKGTEGEKKYGPIIVLHTYLITLCGGARHSIPQSGGFGTQLVRYVIPETDAPSLHSIMNAKHKISSHEGRCSPSSSAIAMATSTRAVDDVSIEHSIGIDIQAAEGTALSKIFAPRDTDRGSSRIGLLSFPRGGDDNR